MGSVAGQMGHGGSGPDADYVGRIRLDGRRCIEARRRRGLSRSGLASLAEPGFPISEATVKRAEHGAAIHLEKAGTLARLLGVPLEDLLPVAERPIAGGERGPSRHLGRDLGRGARSRRTRCGDRRVRRGARGRRCAEAADPPAGRRRGAREDATPGRGTAPIREEGLPVRLGPRLRASEPCPSRRSTARSARSPIASRVAARPALRRARPTPLRISRRSGSSCGATSRSFSRSTISSGPMADPWTSSARWLWRSARRRSGSSPHPS